MEFIDTHYLVTLQAKVSVFTHWKLLCEFLGTNLDRIRVNIKF